MTKKREVNFYLLPIIKMLSKLQIFYYSNIDETLKDLAEQKNIKILKKSTKKILETKGLDSELLKMVERLCEIDHKQEKQETPSSPLKFYNTIEATAIVLKFMHTLKNNVYNDDRLESLLEQSVEKFMEYTIEITDHIYNSEIKKKSTDEKSRN